MTGIRAPGIVCALFGAVALIAQPAEAQQYRDTRPCVTNHELWTTPGGLSRAELENRWEVAGKGRRMYDPLLGRGWAYPICDHPMGERFAVAQFQPGYGLVGVGEIRPGSDRSRGLAQ